MPTLCAAFPLLLLVCLCLRLAEGLYQRRPPFGSIIKVRASGFLPFESDLLLPLGILRQLQAQDRSSRLIKSPRPRQKQQKQQVRLERAHVRGQDAANGVNMYNLIDDDGELLLNLRVHSNNGLQEAPPPILDRQQQLLPSQPLLYDSPWLPSMWRPTQPPTQPAVTSSSPRPLPLRQYLTSRMDQPQPKPPPQQRLRSSDWPFH